MLSPVQIIKRDIQRVNKVIADFPKVMAKDAIAFFKINFVVGGFVDNSNDPWEKRKRNYSHPLLVKSGSLSDSIKILKITPGCVTIGSELEYAKLHNDGGPAMAFGKYPFTMPKRQIIGFSNLLNAQLIKKLDAQIRNIFI